MQNNQNVESAGMKMGGFSSLFSKFLTFIGGPVIVSYIVTGVIILALISSSVGQLSQNNLDAESDAATAEVTAYFDRYYNMAEDFAVNQQIIQALNDLNGSLSDVTQYQYYNQMVNTFANTVESQGGTVMAVYIADPDANELIHSDNFVAPDDFVVEERPWYVQMKKEGKTIMTEPYEDAVTGAQTVTVATPVFKPGTNEIIGGVGIDFVLDKLVKQIASYKLGETGFYILTTESGQIMYSPIEDDIYKSVADAKVSKDFSEAMIADKAGKIEYELDGEHSHGYISPVGDTGWMLATGLPDSEFYKSFNLVRATMITIFALVAIAIVVIILFVSRQIVGGIKSLKETTDQIADGNLDVVAEIRSRDETGQMAESINRTVVQLRRYTAYIREISATLEKMAKGDMRIDLKEEYVGDFAVIRTAFEDIAVSLNDALTKINIAAEEVSTGAAQVSSGAQALASGSTEQAATVEELNASVMTVAEHAERNEQHVNTTTAQLENTAKRLTEGNNGMQQLSVAMEDIKSSSNQIANITNIIEDIAFQTNILALNAAIEAARAGAAGKGFAVVADEVRSLAAKSAEAARQTGELIHASVKTVEKGTQLATQTAHMLQEVEEETSKVVESIMEIKRVSAEQTEAIDQIKFGISQVSSVVQTNAATAEENSATSEEMSAQAATLHEEVSKFKLDNRLSAYRPSVVSVAEPLPEIKSLTLDDPSSDFGKY